MKRLMLPILLILLIACNPSPLPPTNTPAVSADPALDSAIAQARATLSEFITRTATPNSAHSLIALKARFSLPEGGPRDIWLDEAAHENGRFTGNMGDDLPSLHLAFDDPYEIPAQNIIDWMIVENDVLIGGFTIRLAYSRMTPTEKNLFLLDAGYSLE